MGLLSQIDLKNVPRHVAIIMDGNGRWAKSKGLERTEGHRVGAEVIEQLMDAALAANIHCISLYAFSTENWSRPPSEVQCLWLLFEEFFEKKLPVMIEKGVRVVHSGFEKKLPSGVLAKIHNAVKMTTKCKKITLNFCLNYGGRQEIIAAANEWLLDKKPGEMLTEKKLEKFLFTKGLPDVDLMIRTSGEKRISNFLLWQCAYAEFVFTDRLWPDFNANDLYTALLEYQKRARRFGGV